MFLAISLASQQAELALDRMDAPSGKVRQEAEACQAERRK
jgi:hypothetical protein